MSKFVRKTLCAFLITLVIGMGAYFTVTKGVNVANTATISQEVQTVNRTFEERQALESKVTFLNNTLKECGKLEIANGNLESEYVYDSHSEEVMSQEASNMLKSLHKLLYQQKLDIKGVYDYNIKYDLSGIDVKIDEITNKVTISVSESRIIIEDIRERDDTITVGEKYGLATDKLTGQQINTAMTFARHKVYNYLITDNTVASGAVNSLKHNLESLAKSFGIKDVEVFVYKNLTITKDDAYQTISNHNQSGKGISFNANYNN